MLGMKLFTYCPNRWGLRASGLGFVGLLSRGQMPNISPAVFLNLVVLGWKVRMIIGWFDVPAGGFSKILAF